MGREVEARRVLWVPGEVAGGWAVGVVCVWWRRGWMGVEERLESES